MCAAAWARSMTGRRTTAREWISTWWRPRQLNWTKTLSTTHSRSHDARSTTSADTSTNSPGSPSRIVYLLLICQLLCYRYSSWNDTSRCCSFALQGEIFDVQRVTFWDEKKQNWHTEVSVYINSGFYVFYFLKRKNGETDRQKNTWLAIAKHKIDMLVLQVWP